MLLSLRLKQWKVLFVVMLLSKVVAPLLAIFYFHFSWYSWGTLYFQRFLHGSYLIKKPHLRQEPSLSGKGYRPFCMKCKENMKSQGGEVTFAYSSAEATFLHFRCRTYVNCRCSSEWLFFLRRLLGRMIPVFWWPSPCMGLPILVVAFLYWPHWASFLGLGICLV